MYIVFVLLQILMITQMILVYFYTLNNCKKVFNFSKAYFDIRFTAK